MLSLAWYINQAVQVANVTTQMELMLGSYRLGVLGVSMFLATCTKLYFWGRKVVWHLSTLKLATPMTLNYACTETATEASLFASTF